MGTFNKVTFANASPRGAGDNRLNSIPAKAKHVNDLIDSLQSGDNTYAGANTFSGNNVGITNLKTTTATWAAGANIDSGAIAIPANSIITKLTAVVTTAFAQANGTVGISVGTAAGGTQFTGTLDADSLEGTATAVAVGIGTSTDDVLTAALGGTAIMGPLAAAYRSAATDVHFRAVSAGGDFSAGAMLCIVEYIMLTPGA